MKTLVSVRSVAEAKLALDGGADWIDIKEPAAGALGAASIATIEAIVRLVDGARPVSATVGETWDRPQLIPERVQRLAGCGLDYVKAGVGGTASSEESIASLRAAAAFAPLIAVCAAERAEAATRVIREAGSGLAGVMLDTVDKSGPGLSALVDIRDLRAFTALAREQDLVAGLAGKLLLEDIEPLLGSGADYLGFRSALCRAGDRGAGLDGIALRRVVAAVRGKRGDIPQSISEVA